MKNLLKVKKEVIDKTAWEKLTSCKFIPMTELSDNENANSIRINVKINGKNFFEFGLSNIGSLPNQPKFPNFFLKPPLSIEIKAVVKALREAQEYLESYLNKDQLKEIIEDHEKHYSNTNLLDPKLKCETMLF